MCYISRFGLTPNLYYTMTQDTDILALTTIKENLTINLALLSREVKERELLIQITAFHRQSATKRKRRGHNVVPLAVHEAWKSDKLRTDRLRCKIL